MKRFLLTTAIVTASAGFAFAENHTGGDAAMKADSATEMNQSASASGTFLQESDPNYIQASNFIGMRVYTAEKAVEQDAMQGIGDNWEDIGEINDVILGRDGSVEGVLVDVGGFLGIGERQIAVDMNSIKFVSDEGTADIGNDFFLVINSTQEELENAPEYQTAMATGAAATSGDMTTGDATTGGQMEAADASDPEMQPAEGDVNTAAAETEQAMDNAGEEVAQAADQTGQAIENAGEEASQEMAEAANETGQAIDNATDEAQQEMAEAGQDAEQALEGDDQTEMAAGEPAMGNDGMTDNGMATDGTMAADNQGMSTEYQSADFATLTTEDLTGAPVYDRNDERIGEVAELVLTADGKLDKAVIDVGGFLGLGEKPVALNFDELDTRTNGSNFRVYVQMTEDELEQMPEFED